MKRHHLIFLSALAGIGLLAGLSARADEGKLTPVNTALSNTTISGYVNVAAEHVNPASAGANTTRLASPSRQSWWGVWEQVVAQWWKWHR